MKMTEEARTMSRVVKWIVIVLALLYVVGNAFYLLSLDNDITVGVGVLMLLGVIFFVGDIVLKLKKKGEKEDEKV
jgi:membrane protein YdbS with pleckstrin-like domain